MVRVRTLLRRFVLALQFLTRIPIRVMLDLKDGDFPGCAVFFPWVGGIIGGLGFLVWWGVDALTRQLPYAGALAGLLTVTMVTGALHLDGLGDTCDGVFSGRSRERALEIMKDSRSGAFGVLGMCMALLAKMVFFGGLLAGKPPYIAFLLWAAATMAGRIAIVTAAALGKPARLDGSGRLFLAQMGFSQWLGALLLGSLLLGGLLAATGLFSWGWLAGWLTALAAAALLTAALSHKLDGLTGDCLGAANEAGEVCFLLVIAAWGCL